MHSQLAEQFHDAVAIGLVVPLLGTRRDARLIGRRLIVKRDMCEMTIAYRCELEQSPAVHAMTVVAIVDGARA
jgi:hypothetical protein